MIRLKENQELTKSQKKKFKQVLKNINSKKKKSVKYSIKLDNIFVPNYKVAKAFRNLYGK